MWTSNPNLCGMDMQMLTADFLIAYWIHLAKWKIDARVLLN